MELDLRTYFQIIWKRRWQIVLLFGAAVLVSFFASRAMTPVYRASTKLLVKQAGPGGEFALFGELGGMVRNQVQNYVEILKSRSLARSMGEILGLDLEDKEGRFAQLRKSITIQPIQGTDAITVNVESTDPEEAAGAANALVEAFKRRTQHENQSDVRSARQFIESQLNSVRDELSQAEDAVQEYQSQAGVVQPTQEATALVNRLAELEAAKAEAEVAVFEGSARLKEIERQLSDREKMVVSAQTLSENPVVAQYKRALADLNVQRAQALGKYAPGHPTVVAIDAQIADIETRLKVEMEQVISAETVTLNPLRQALIQQTLEIQAGTIAAQARRDGLERLIRDTEKRFYELPSQEVQLARLMRSRSVLESIYLMLMQKHEEFRISEEMKTADVQIIDTAEVPESPVRPRTMLNVAVAGFLALFVGCGLAFLLEYLDTTIKTTDDVQQHLGLPVLGLIPSNKLEQGIERGKKAKFVRFGGISREG